MINPINVENVAKAYLVQHEKIHIERNHTFVSSVENHLIEHDLLRHLKKKSHTKK